MSKDNVAYPVMQLTSFFQDMQCVADCETSHPKLFEQPVIQTLQMFVGESGCWLVVFASFMLRYIKKDDRVTANGGMGYSPVERRDSGETTSEEEEDSIVQDLSSSQTLVDPTNIIAKPLLDENAGSPDRKPLQGWRVTMLALPAICDICGTTLMNAGLLFVAASIYQMTRGALVLFVGLFSVIFLKRHLGGWKWASLFVVVLGVAVVGLAGALEGRHGDRHLPGDTRPGGEQDLLVNRALRVARNAVSTTEAHTAAETVIGICMIAGAQIFTASQFVLEESIMASYAMDPIRVVGFEGVFGFLLTLIGMGVLHAAIGTGYFNAREAFHEVFTNQAIGVTSLLIMISIG